MKRFFLILSLLHSLAFLLAQERQNYNHPTSSPTPADAALADYFRHETATLTTRCLADIKTLDDWQERRVEYRRQLQEMLGLWPMPDRTDLKPVVTGRLELDDIIVEKLHFQASPQLYVTANLYIPKNIPGPCPTILYACGHSRAITNGISLGNKTGYQHHGAWFARNGYVCMLIDTLQLGEIPGVHQGTQTQGMWWWNSRGYTPAGVETWFGIRALDYLCSRPEVDQNRIGMTGRSGGGSYTWTVAALDNRVKVICPVAGITDLENQIVDDCVDGHCDCMFYLNTYRWDFAQVAALIAPRPLLICNSDKDRIFPLDGVLRIHQKTRDVYGLYEAKEKLGLLITEGPHMDTQELQLPVFRWFNRFLKQEQPLIELAAKKLFDPQRLRVFDQPPADQLNTNIQATFVPYGQHLNAAELKQQRGPLIDTIRQKSFGAWPAEDTPLDVERVFSLERKGVKFSAFDFTSQRNVPLRCYLMESTKAHPAVRVALNVLDQETWNSWLGSMRNEFAEQLKEELQTITTTPTKTDQNDQFDQLIRISTTKPVAVAFFTPRGVGLTSWSGDAKRLTQIRRRFMLLGQTLDGMRLWDIRRAVKALHLFRESDNTIVELHAPASMSGLIRMASLFEPGVRNLEINTLNQTDTEGGDYFNLLRILDRETLSTFLDLDSKHP